MSARLKAEEPTARYLAESQPPLVRQFELMATAPGGVARLRELILTLAVRGRLVAQDPTDEPAFTLLAHIRAERQALFGNANSEESQPVSGALRDESAVVPVGWVQARFEDFILALCTGPFGSVIHKDDYVPGGVPLINPSHMVNGRIVHDPDIAIPPSMAQSLRNYHLRSGDVLLARRGEVGRYALVTENEEGWLCGTGSFFVKLHPECNRRYFGLMLEDPRLRRYLQGESVGSTMTNLNQKILLGAVLIIPPLAEQARIVARVTELRRLCADLRQRLADGQATQSRLAEALVESATT